MRRRTRAGAAAVVVATGLVAAARYYPAYGDLADLDADRNLRARESLP